MAGLTVVGLERGPDRRPRRRIRAAAHPRRAEIWSAHGADGDNSVDTVAFRNTSDMTARCRSAAGARSCRAKASAAPSNHWGGLHWRYLPTRLQAAGTTLTETLRRQRHSGRHDDRGLAGQPMTSSSRYYDKFDKLCGVSGKAGNLKRPEDRRRQRIRRPARERISEQAAEDRRKARLMFAEAAKSLGYHPFPRRSAASSALYEHLRRDARRMRILRLLRHATAARPMPRPRAPPMCMPRAAHRSEIRAQNTRVRDQAPLRQAGARRSPASLYTDMKTGEEYEQPAGIVVLSAYVFSNTHMLLYSGIGEPYDPADGQGSRRQELLLSVRSARRRRSSRTGASIRSWARRATPSSSTTTSTATISTTPGWASSAAATSAGGSGAHRRSADATCPKARRRGARSGRRRPCSWYYHVGRLQHAGLGLRRTARTISISIRPIRIRSAGRSLRHDL